MGKLLIVLRVLIIAGALASIFGQPVWSHESLLTWIPGIAIWDQREVVRLVFTAIGVGLL